jgi:zinc D-Ala-D-Ala carboxypeptidase
MIQKLSEHLSLQEIIKSQTASRHGIQNTPSTAHLNNLRVLANELFEPIRAAVSADRGKDTPVSISSGYRSKLLNDKIGGSTRSQHSTGQAIDIDLDGWYEDFSNADLFFLIVEDLDFDQIIWEFGDEDNPDWVHVSYVNQEANRKKITKAYKKDGKTHYVNKN